MITNNNYSDNNDSDNNLFCKKCLNEDIPKPHYHVTINNTKTYCPIHNDICNYCNSVNHDTNHCPLVKITVISKYSYKNDNIFKCKLHKNSNFRLISKKNKNYSKNNNAKLINIIDDMSKLTINNNKKISWFDDKNE